MELKAQVEQMKEEEQPKALVGDEYVTNTGTLDRYFVIKNNNKIRLSLNFEGSSADSVGL